MLFEITVAQLIESGLQFDFDCLKRINQNIHFTVVFEYSAIK
jgi:hypothetical protein